MRAAIDCVDPYELGFRIVGRAITTELIVCSYAGLQELFNCLNGGLDSTE